MFSKTNYRIIKWIIEMTNLSKNIISIVVCMCLRYVVFAYCTEYDIDKNICSLFYIGLDVYGKEDGVVLPCRVSVQAKELWIEKVR